MINSLGFKQASLITSILLFTQMIFDYPSGSLGDLIGYRWVLTISYSCYSVGYIFLAISETVLHFIIIAIVFGLGHAQASGALQSYLDNNYKKINSESDPERKNYGFSISRIGSLDNCVILTAFIVGGGLATLSSRRFVFSIQSIMAILLIFIVLTTLKNPTDQKQEKTENDATSDYFQYLKGGLYFVFSSQKVFFYIIGFSIFSLIWVLWSSLILFPVYFGYTGSDSLAGLLRSSLYLIGVVLSIKAATWTKKVANHRLPIFIIILTAPLFIGFMLLLYLLPYNDKLDVVGFAAIMILMTSTVSLLSPFIWTLHQRVLIDLVPSENRNGIYSLMPSLTNAFAIPLLPVMGTMISDNGMVNGVMVLLVISIIAFLWIAYAIRLMYPPQTNIQVEPEISVVTLS
jgi:MFS family permease